MRRVALVLAMAIPLAVAGCGDSTGPGGSVAGTYELRSINGDPVPVTTDESGSFREEITAGFVRLNANGSFSAGLTFRVTNGTVVTTETLEINGTYTRSGNRITLTFQDPDGPGTATAAAFWDGDLLTVEDDLGLWVYER
jgi:hypothetical protein